MTLGTLRLLSSSFWTSQNWALQKKWNLIHFWQDLLESESIEEMSYRICVWKLLQRSIQHPILKDVYIQSKLFQNSNLDSPGVSTTDKVVKKEV